MDFQLNQQIIITADGARANRNAQIGKSALLAAACALPAGPILGGMGLVGKGSAIAIKVWASTAAICSSSGSAGAAVNALIGNPPEAGQRGRINQIKENRCQVRWADASTSWHKAEHLQSCIGAGA